MSSHAKAAAVVYAKDIARVSAFYKSTAGLEAVRSEADHVVLESPAFELFVVAIPEHIAASIELADPPLRRTETPIKLIFTVASIGAARTAARTHGGELNPPEREWQLQGFRICDGHDPEGNIVQFRECVR